MLPPLHSTMFLLIQNAMTSAGLSETTLHSTMFLLIRSGIYVSDECYKTLHSTMFLLIRVVKHQKESLMNFTFHNVSINTETREAIQGVNYNTLHSTMFLLIPVLPCSPCDIQHSLHSTMFLLIPFCQARYLHQSSSFTFHNVSINTGTAIYLYIKGINFTFHNVSINTVKAIH